MLKYVITSLFIVSATFSGGLKPSFDVAFGWSRTTMSYDDPYHGEYSEDYLHIKVGTMVPYSRVIGRSAELLAVRFSEITQLSVGGGTDYLYLLGFRGKVGFVEMVPSRTVAPYFTQHIVLDRYTYEGSDLTIFGIALGVGAEFMHQKKLTPFIEATLSFSTHSWVSRDFTNFGGSAGVRYSWMK